MQKYFFKLLVELCSLKIASDLLKKVTLSNFSRLLIKRYIKVYPINIDEMEKPLEEYKTLHELFTRNLKPGIRKIDGSLNTVVSPVDGILSSYGKVTMESTFHVKGRQYSLAELLGNINIAEKYQNGSFAVLYLSPYHYHKVHAPLDGAVTEQWTLGGKSYPVNDLGYRFGNCPLVTNHRVITEVINDFGNHAVIMVGALNINSIHVTTENFLEKGKEMGYFSFGSSVVLLTDNSNYEFNSQLMKDMEVKVGMALGEFPADSQESKNETSKVKIYN